MANNLPDHRPLSHDWLLDARSGAALFSLPDLALQEIVEHGAQHNDRRHLGNDVPGWRNSRLKNIRGECKFERKCKGTSELEADVVLRAVSTVLLEYKPAKLDKRPDDSKTDREGGAKFSKERQVSDDGSENTFGRRVDSRFCLLLGWLVLPGYTLFRRLGAVV